MDELSTSKYIGIDVSKARLDVAVGEDGASWSEANTAEGIGRLVKQISEYQPALIAIESTGGLERPVLAELDRMGLPVALVNPKRVREFAKAIGVWAKTDKLDARLLARFARMSSPWLPIGPARAMSTFRPCWRGANSCWRC
jgi:transposase